jgi:NAD(P)-dependent dehydrogenase (short-subunit alcohol dehydrogenase family)
MTTATTSVPARREPDLLGQTVVVIGGSAGIGLETARHARREGADVVLTGRDPERLKRAAQDLEARSSAAFDANDPAAMKRFFDELPDPIDHVMVTAGGPHYKPLLEMDADEARGALGGHAVLALEVARNVAGRIRPGGTLVLMGGTGGRRIRRDLVIVSAATAALPPLTATLALELAPRQIAVNGVAPGMILTPMNQSAIDHPDELKRKEAAIPWGRAGTSEEVAELVAYLLSPAADYITGTTVTIDGALSLTVAQGA